jgi:mono/diheme cytochrome c family protein
LRANPAAADAAYVTAVIEDGKSGPLEVLGSNYDAAMPAVSALSDADIPVLVDYVTNLASQGATPVDSGTDGDAEAVPVVGDIDRGHDLFTGSNRFDSGGVACAACHTAGSVGNLSGGGLSPDLTDSFSSLGGEAGLSAWLSNPPSQTMMPIFSDHPLNEAELADVVAFLGDTPNQDDPDGSVDRLLLTGVVGMIILIGGMAIAWRGMRQTYVQRIRSKR